MQISAANLIVAAQQAPNAAVRPAAPAHIVAKPEAKDPSDFEPMSFKQAAPDKPAPAASAQGPSTTSLPIGSQVDIRV